ncbi:MAG: hypothetical protein AAF658_11750, partial [Myxococcota bacterium]
MTESISKGALRQAIDASLAGSGPGPLASEGADSVSAEELTAAIDSYDMNGDGSITASEVRQIHAGAARPEASPFQSLAGVGLSRLNPSQRTLVALDRALDLLGAHTTDGVVDGAAVLAAADEVPGRDNVLFALLEEDESGEVSRALVREIGDLESPSFPDAFRAWGRDHPALKLSVVLDVVT